MLCQAARRIFWSPGVREMADMVAVLCFFVAVLEGWWCCRCCDADVDIDVDLVLRPKGGL